MKKVIVLLLTIAMLVGCVERRGNAFRTEDNHNVNYSVTRLNTGDQPYSKYYGENIPQSDNYIAVKTSGYKGMDVLVLVKNQSNDVVGNLYIRGGGAQGIIYVYPGTYHVFFYAGMDWSKEKPMKGKIKGGFTKDENYTKDPSLTMTDGQYVNYVLELSQSGNFSAETYR
jgi:hypothetical protein